MNKLLVLFRAWTQRLRPLSQSLAQYIHQTASQLCLALMPQEPQKEALSCAGQNSKNSSRNVRPCCPSKAEVFINAVLVVFLLAVIFDLL